MCFPLREELCHPPPFLFLFFFFFFFPQRTASQEPHILLTPQPPPPPTARESHSQQRKPTCCRPLNSAPGEKKRNTCGRLLNAEEAPPNETQTDHRGDAASSHGRPEPHRGSFLSGYIRQLTPEILLSSRSTFQGRSSPPTYDSRPESELSWLVGTKNVGIFVLLFFGKKRTVMAPHKGRVDGCRWLRSIPNVV